MSDEKPELNLVPGDATEEEIIALYTRLTGRAPTADELEELRADMAEDAE